MLSKDGLNHDSQCWGKTAIVKALYDLAWQDSNVFIDACKTIQLEPIYGGQGDSAVAVRTAGIQALVQLPAAEALTVINTIADLLADESPKVRAEAARSCVYCQPVLVSALLRLKIRLGDAEPRVLGVCFDSLLLLSPGSDTVNLVLEYAKSKTSKKRFSPSHDVIQAEAIASLASSNVAEAVNGVSRLYSTFNDLQLRRILLTALGASPTTEAYTFLLESIKEAPIGEAKWALESLKPKQHDPDVKREIEACLQKRKSKELLEMYKGWS
jgi:HEAT repeat protein